MNQKKMKTINWKKWLSFFMAFTFLFLGTVIERQEIYAAQKSHHSIKIMQNRKNIEKKTWNIKAGHKEKITIKTKPSIEKKNIKFQSSDKEIVTVNKNGIIRAKKAGSARVTITVSKRGYKTKKTWIIISVQEEEHNNAENTTDTSDDTENTEQPETVKPAETPKPEASENNKDDSAAIVENPVKPEENGTGTEEGKILVAYFSWSGTSEKIAQNIIAQTGADSFRIERETPYSDDYNTVAYGEAKEEADANARPKLKEPLDSVAEYNKIVLCYPIWWHTAPMTVGTFLESYDFTGKSIYPISQSASMSVSQYEESVAFIKSCAGGAMVDDGLFTKNDEEIKKYIENTVLKP